jgi:hypothetical protein
MHDIRDDPKGYEIVVCRDVDDVLRRDLTPGAGRPKAAFHRNDNACTLWLSTEGGVSSRVNPPRVTCRRFGGTVTATVAAGPDQRGRPFQKVWHHD